eukprot:jgi/Bigna1/70481/fgenesh1_pg.12_\
MTWFRIVRQGKINILGKDVKRLLFRGYFRRSEAGDSLRRAGAETASQLQSDSPQPREEDKLANDDIPQGISQEQIDTACMVLERLKGHISSKSCRKLRQALHPWVKELSGRMYHGGSKEGTYNKGTANPKRGNRGPFTILKMSIDRGKHDYDRKIAADKQKTSLKHQMRRLDEEYINAVTLRKKRVDALKKLLEEQPGREAFPLIADGAAESAVPRERGQRLLQSGGRGDTKEKRDGQGGSTSLLVGEAEEAKSAEPYHGKEGEIEMGGQDDGSSQVVNMKDTNGESARRKEKKQQQQQQQQQKQESDFATWKGRLDIYGLDFRNVAGDVRLYV